MNLSHQKSLMQKWRQVFQCITGIALVVLMASCASTQLVSENGQAQPSKSTKNFGVLSQVDPFESFNRKAYEFNENLDNIALKPVAQAYKKYTPDLFRTGVSNFFFNLSSVWTVVNNILQGHGQAAAEGVIRVGVNTIFGFVGVFDIASEMNIDRHKADFGQTLGRWGVPPGPYLVIPILGPSTLRDSLASTVIAKGDLVWQLEDVSLRNSLYAFRAIDQRANLLNATNMLDDSALDKYTFSRDIFLQLRMNEVEQAVGHSMNSDEYLEDLPVQTPPNELPAPQQTPDTQSQEIKTLLNQTGGKTEVLKSPLFATENVTQESGTEQNNSQPELVTSISLIQEESLLQH